MPVLKSKRVSLAVLASMLSANWYVNVQTTGSEPIGAPDLAGLRISMPTLPALDATQLPPALASISKDFHERLLSFQEFPALTLMSPLHIGMTESLSQQAMPPVAATEEIAPAPQLVNASSGTQNTLERVVIENKAATPPASSRNRHTQQPDNLLKVLALYYMLNR